ncbi:hypothetical protein P7K49_030454 [Saguinus oedipus]|uniref:Uncharacterized protein n=1 Tax=Saguinus oedipus TaxID=9490 RepID=A0ABQ9U328_SAGOE|nr:hypothetical protein P7K49_030454 [Saguinus oedipus]
MGKAPQITSPDASSLSNLHFQLLKASHPVPTTSLFTIRIPPHSSKLVGSGSLVEMNSCGSAGPTALSRGLARLARIPVMPRLLNSADITAHMGMGLPTTSSVLPVLSLGAFTLPSPASHRLTAPHHLDIEDATYTQLSAQH